MSEIQPFESFDSQAQIEAHSAGLPRIVLEGKDDVKFFEQFWFTDYLSRFEFVEAGKIGEHGGGCAAVAAAVAFSREHDGIPAFGVVDRDTLFRQRCWAGLYELDDAKFLDHANDDNVFIASLWEVEAYVLSGERLAEWVEGNHSAPPGSPAACAAAPGKAIKECELLLQMAPFLAAMHVGGETVAVEYFSGEMLDAIEEKCRVVLANIDLRHQVHADIVQMFLDKVMEGAPADTENRLRWFLKYVDTKRLFVRLRSALNLHAQASHWQLATIMKRTGDRPAELENYLVEAEAKLAVA